MSDSSNKFSIGEISFVAFGDRVLIEQDEFKSGYECPRCLGSTKIPCDNCFGTGHNGSKKCSFCSDGAITCTQCLGKGGVLIVPEESERRPTTGRIVSIGEEVKSLSIGQSVLFSSYAGHTVDLNRAGHAVVLRILHEPEILSLVEGHLDLRTVRGKSDIAQYQN